MLRILKWLLLGLLAAVGVGFLLLRFMPEGPYKPHELTDAELAFVEQIEVPDFPPDWRFATYESFDGTTLRWGETGNADTAKATLVYVPGYNGTISAYADQFGMWAREGWHVVGLDMRGQGGSEGNPYGEKLPRLVRDGDVLNSRDIIGFVESLGITDRPVVLVGSSYGGFATTLAVLESPSIAEGYIALVPAYRPKMPEGTYRQVAIATRLGFGGRYGPGQGVWKPFGTDFTPPAFCPTDHPRVFRQVRIQAEDPDQRVGGATIGLIHDWLELGDEIVSGERGQLAVPTTMILASNDALVENGPPEAFCAANALCETRVWDDTQHCVTLDRDAIVMRVLDEAEALLER